MILSGKIPQQIVVKTAISSNMYNASSPKKGHQILHAHQQLVWMYCTTKQKKRI